MKILLSFLLILYIYNVDARKNFLNKVGSTLTTGAKRAGSAAGKGLNFANNATQRAATGLARGVDEANGAILETSNQIDSVKKSAKKVKQDTSRQFTQSLYGTDYDEYDIDDDEEYEPINKKYTKVKNKRKKISERKYITEDDEDDFYDEYDE